MARLARTKLVPSMCFYMVVRMGVEPISRDWKSLILTDRRTDHKFVDNCPSLADIGGFQHSEKSALWNLTKSILIVKQLLVARTRCPLTLCGGYALSAAAFIYQPNTVIILYRVTKVNYSKIYTNQPLTKRSLFSVNDNKNTSGQSSARLVDLPHNAREQRSTQTFFS